ncbi:cellular morphogenesis regulator DopA [Talaromyces stipitatus ATCC 10500]|uniref:Cellular morphogenesis regulator DopA n=1 Tax=Talaromyces stipitatus (strain ATCC 10500 / CBS 375.48 / QM 6759 / NRRL 1006) TaxID=441959 RepID=B8LT20_TALSN|nr:cellular morphogenesis regulator DopA [Talaromyces stipitatus ATCC 10500]EED23528.1 cellular morphogenesis regulator DopA [Talaromyces stipitatus ATCC 10500]
MSLDPGGFPRTDSPASSDSSLTRFRLRTSDDEHLKKDKNYRRYASTVERALSLFDTTLQEWADYISFLSRLLKALQSHPPDLPVVPHKTTVAKRLAQCLNPSLPSGVHQKALEVYTYIFGLLKPEGLSVDLPLYFPGVAPTLTFASLSVRPLFISLLETYLPELEPMTIRPALKAIILALLPGLEEETSDDFEPTIRTLNKIRNVASQMDTRRSSLSSNAGGQYFWQCMFLASITNPSRRLGVLAYLNRHLPKLGLEKSSTSEKGDDQLEGGDAAAIIESVISPEPGLLIRCFASGLTDDQLLVQRNFLDLLVTHLPLHSAVLQSKIRRDDLEKLILAAAGVVLRRDMSLNRRLWAWFLGPDPSQSLIASPNSTSEKEQDNSTEREQSQSRYFSRNGLDSLVRGLLKMINQDTLQPSQRSRPLRIALSLMDRWEVGGFVVPAVFLPIMRSVQSFEGTADKSHFGELFRSASAFFDGVESSLIFSELLYLVHGDTRGQYGNFEKRENDLLLAHFILANFNIREEEMLLLHIPLLTLAILIEVNDIILMNRPGFPSEQTNIYTQHLFKLLNLVLNLLPERAFLVKVVSENLTSDPRELDNKDLMKSIQQFYDRSKESLELPPLPFTPQVLSELILRMAYRLSMSALEDHDCSLSVKETSGLLTGLLKKAPKSRILGDGHLIQAFHKALEFDAAQLTTQRFAVISSITSIATSLYCIHGAGFYITYQQLCGLLPALMDHLWAFLSPESPKFHVEAVRCIGLLHSITWQDHAVEASITSLMVGVDSPKSSEMSNIQHVERFCVLWSHSLQWGQESQGRSPEGNGANGKPLADRSASHVSLLKRPLFIVLDLLSQNSEEVYQVVRDWVHDMPSIQRVLHIIVIRLEELVNIDDHEDKRQGLIDSDDRRECQYLLQTLSNLMSCLSQNGWITLVSHPVSQVEQPHESETPENPNEHKTFQIAIAETSLALVGSPLESDSKLSAEEQTLQRTALSVLRQLLVGLGAEQLIDTNIHLILIEKLSIALDQNSHLLQTTTIETLLVALKAKFAHVLQPPPQKHRRTGSKGSIRSASLLSLSASLSTDRVDKLHQPPPVPQPPEQLLNCLLKGISSQNSHSCLEKWILLLSESLPLYGESIFQILLMLVECFCREIRKSFSNLQVTFEKTEDWAKDRSEHVTIVLLTGLETCIAAAHERLHAEEVTVTSARSPDHSQTFFGNMVSNFVSDGGPARNVANDRLTVLLCFQDAVRLCFSIWSWRANSKGKMSLDTESVASFQYTSLRMRNRSRALLEHLFTAEALESLETLVELWSNLDPSETSKASHIFSLLHTLDRARPKVIIPAIFNSIYSRTNPAALDPSRKSALASTISDSELAAFLVTYARSLDDDVLDEIWGDCTTFLRDVLANPFPHRQILSRLVEFAGILGAKMENTSFGDDRRMRKELGDLLLRLLAAIFTSKPMGLSQDSGISARPSADADGSPTPHASPDNLVSILISSLPAFLTALGETDRITNAISSISANVISPTLRSRLFPNNVNQGVLDLLQQLSRISASSKVWKKDIVDAFNDPRFFGSRVDLVKTGWMGLLRQWILVDKERFPELLSRLTPPTTAGIMFGVGATAARLEADRKTQLNLRRITLLILANGEDYFIIDYPTLLQKLEDLLQATHISSPSSVTRAELFMVLRALVLRTSTTHMASFWPLINTELQEAISAVPRHQQSELYGPYSLLQASKLLDTLLLLVPDDFQLQEWLFVTDTIDAIYPPGRWEPIALADEIARTLGPGDEVSPVPGELSEKQRLNKPCLNSDRIRETPKDEIVDRILKPFFERISIQAFESTYSMGSPDRDACVDDLLADIFNESTMAN